MAELWAYFTQYDRWPPRRLCGSWYEWEVWWHVLNHAVIWNCYWVIPHLLRRLYDSGLVPEYLGPPQRKLAGAPMTTGMRFGRWFIFLCGLTHALELGVFYVPWYPLIGVAGSATAAVSAVNVALMALALQADPPVPPPHRGQKSGGSSHRATD